MVAAEEGSEFQHFAWVSEGACVLGPSFSSSQLLNCFKMESILDGLMVYTCLPICAGAFLLYHIQLPLEHILSLQRFVVASRQKISLSEWFDRRSILPFPLENGLRRPLRASAPSALHLPGGERGGERAYAIRLGTHTCEPDSGRGRTYSSLLPAYVGSGEEWEWVARRNPLPSN